MQMALKMVNRRIMIELRHMDFNAFSFGLLRILTASTIVNHIPIKIEQLPDRAFALNGIFLSRKKMRDSYMIGSSIANVS